MKDRSSRRAGLIQVFALLSLSTIGIGFAASLDEARALYSEGRIAEAAEAFRVAAIELESTDPLTAAAARNNACVLWRNTGDLIRAEEDCLHALRLRSTDGSTEAQAKTYNNLGLVLQRRAEYDGARRAFERALQINRGLGLAANQAINLSNLGVNAIQAGWYAEAIDLFSQIEDLVTRHAGEHWAGRQQDLARINLAVVHERLGSYREALRLYDEALERGPQLPPGARATLLVNRGVAYRNLGDPVRAEQAFEIAEVTYRELQDQPALLNVLLNRALVQHLNMDRPERAELFYREALALAEELGEATQRLQCLDYLGRFLLDSGRTGEAEILFREAHSLAVESGSSEGTAASLEGLGRCELQRGEIDSALDHALNGIDEIERVRGSLGSEALKASYHAEKRRVYTLAVEALALDSDQRSEQERALQALHIVHRAKARELVDRLGLDDGPVLSDARLQIGRGRVLVEYFVAGDRLFGWLVTDRTIEMRDLGAAASVLDDAADVYTSLSSARPPDTASLDALGQRLLSSFSMESLQQGRWTIATDRGLDRLPFEILTDPLSDSRLLVERVDLSYLPSGAMLAIVSEPPSREPFVGIGDPLQDGARGPASYLARRFDLGQLEGASEELSSLTSWIGEPVELHQREKATEEAFERAYTEGARVLHVATHTVLDDSSQRSSAILLSPGESSDGLLHPVEIARFEGACRLTVLAACRTAAVTDTDDLALRGLTGALLVSGSSAVLVTLWDVGDVTTRVFMEQFYHGLGRGQRPDVALSSAKRTLISDPAWNDPSIWAAYVLVGDAIPVTDGGPVALWWAIPAVILGVYGLNRLWRYGRMSNRAG